jgi:hypothetical protein
MPAHSGVWLKLYPCSGGQHQVGQVAQGEGPDLEQREPEQRLGHLRFHDAEHHQRG